MEKDRSLVELRDGQGGLSLADSRGFSPVGKKLYNISSGPLKKKKKRKKKRDSGFYTSLRWSWADSLLLPLKKLESEKGAFQISVLIRRRVVQYSTQDRD